MQRRRLILLKEMQMPGKGRYGMMMYSAAAAAAAADDPADVIVVMEVVLVQD
jgi:hypothetical protein